MGVERSTDAIEAKLQMFAQDVEEMVDDGVPFPGYQTKSGFKPVPADELEKAELISYGTGTYYLKIDDKFVQSSDGTRFMLQL